MSNARLGSGDETRFRHLAGFSTFADEDDGSNATGSRGLAGFTSTPALEIIGRAVVGASVALSSMFGGSSQHVRGRGLGVIINKA